MNESQACPTETKIRDRVFRHATRKTKRRNPNRRHGHAGPAQAPGLSQGGSSPVSRQNRQRDTKIQKIGAVSVLTTPGSSPLHSCVPSFILTVEPRLTSHRHPLTGSGALGAHHLPSAPALCSLQMAPTPACGSGQRAARPRVALCRCPGSPAVPARSRPRAPSPRHGGALSEPSLPSARAPAYCQEQNVQVRKNVTCYTR